MKHLIIILFIQLCFPSFSQYTEKELDERRTWFREINKNTNHYRREEYIDIQVFNDLNPDEYSMEGQKVYRLAMVNMIKWFKNQQLVKIAVTFEGDRENLTSEYYFKNGDLFFVDKVKTIYHSPKWDEAFNESEKSVAKNRFYIKHDKLIKWVNTDLYSAGKMDPGYEDHEKMILNDYQLYKRIGQH